MSDEAQQEILRGERFSFGENWNAFSQNVSAQQVEAAVNGLSHLLQVERLDDRTFLDVGCGSGLSSLAACKLGARVTSLDFDPTCVATTRELLAHFGAQTDNLLQGSALSPEFMRGLPQFDIVYSWGVLHHTGDMWKGVALSCERVAENGYLALAIYNDQGGVSRRWLTVKKIYNHLPRALQPAYASLFFAYFEGRSALIKLARLQNPLPFADWRRRKADRGMSVWRDLLDWVGGFPFEVAKPEEIFAFCRERGFELRNLKTCGGGLGCNEFLFQKVR